MTPTPSKTRIVPDAKRKADRKTGQPGREKIIWGLRRKLYSAAILKMSDTIWDAARLCGVEAVHMNLHHTSKKCTECRKTLSGDYHRRTCRHCKCSVDRDVNSGEQAPRQYTARRFGLAWAKPDAMRT